MARLAAVLDTNVLVSRTLTPHGTPARVVDAVLAGAVIPCYDRRILQEYREVLSRARFGFAPDEIESLLAQILGNGLSVIAAPVRASLPDESDRPFAEAAVTAGAHLVTGNLTHYPGLDRAISPVDFLRLIQEPEPSPR